jgi:phosphopantetheine adenylyltransferase
MSEQNQKGTVNIDNLLANANESQLFVMEKWSRLVGKVLSNIEIALPEGRQYMILKRLLNDIIYGARNNLLLYFRKEVTIAEAQATINEEVEAMMIAIENKLDMTFPQLKQQQAIKASVSESVNEIIEDVLEYFSSEE